jgi:hypothetical protein
MNKIKKESFWVKVCAECPLCRYTRACKELGVKYYFYRVLELLCPCCHLANRQLGKNFQKSRVIKGKME